VCFKLGRREISQTGVKAFEIIHLFKKNGEMGLGLLKGTIVFQINLLLFQGLIVVRKGMQC
jgi:hypothetical protein